MCVLSPCRPLVALPPGYDLLDVCVNGPADRLNSTEVSQPAIYVASLAALEKMKTTEEGAAAIEAVDVCAGLSLGEYTALTFAGAITFEDGVKLVKLRGESMQAAADATPSGMASVIGLDAEKVGEVCKARARPLMRVYPPELRSNGFSPEVNT